MFVLHLDGRQSEYLLRALVERDDPPVQVQGHNATGDIRDDVLVQGLKIAEVGALFLQNATRLFEPLGQLATQKCHKEKRDGIDEGLKKRISGIGCRPWQREELRPIHEPLELDVDQCSIEDAAPAGQQQAGPPREEDGRSEDRKDIDKREEAVDSAGVVRSEERRVGKECRL